MAEKHTALPWKLSNMAFDREFRTFLVNEKHEQVVETKGDTMEEAIDNAMLILRVVNSHHKLLEACEGMLKWFGRYPEWIPSPDHIEKSREAIEEARQAFAEATKEVERS